MISENQSLKPWKVAWLEAQATCRGLGAHLWSLTQSLNRVFDDAEFRADNNLRDDLAAADWIDSHLPEIPLGYMELRTIIKHYPDKSTWEELKLSRLRDSIRFARSEPKVVRPKAAITRHTPQIAKPTPAETSAQRSLDNLRRLGAETLGDQMQAERAVAADSKTAAYHARALTAILTREKDRIEYADTSLIRSLEALAELLSEILEPALTTWPTN